MFGFFKKDKKEKEHVFVWKGKDSKGRSVSGESRATNELLVKVSLRSKGIKVEKVRKQAFKRGKPVKQKDVAVFTRQLAAMLKAGVPLLKSFDIVASGYTNPNVKRLLLQIKSEVESGTSLATAFANHPKHFDKLYSNLVGAGEESGHIDSVLDRLATYQEKIASLKSKIKKAMMYPLAVITISFIVTAIIMIFVIPTFKDLFESFGAELPAPTLFVISVSNYFTEYWYIIFGSIFLGLFSFFKSYKRIEKFKDFVDALLLKMPVVGPILNKSAVARWCRTFSTMYSAGVPLVESLTSVGNAAGNAVYFKATQSIQKEVTKGESLANAIQQEKIFPHMMIQMAQIGEESGSLDDMLNKVAEYYEEQVDDTVAAINSLIEPFIILFLGVIIGGLVISMYLPIFKMASVV